jgi:hypothetical protein
MNDAGEVTQAQVIVRLGEALVEHIDLAGPHDLKAAAKIFEERMNNHAVRASYRRLYRAIAEILRDQAAS